MSQNFKVQAFNLSLRTSKVFGSVLIRNVNESLSFATANHS
uniref:Uncharacterized protein n=1 Tax=Anguilla anguilla TaxID=7936 RepID=A0A0E9VWB5_ANGAN